MCWVEILQYDDDFSKKLSAINYNVLKYPIIINILYILLQNALVIPFFYAETYTVALISCWAIIVFDYQCMTLKMEYTISLVLTQNYLKGIENKLYQLDNDGKFEKNGEVVTFKDLNAFYSKACSISRNMLDILWIPIITLLVEVVSVVIIQSYMILSRFYGDTNLYNEMFPLSVSLIWFVDAICTIILIICPSYLSTGRVSITFILDFVFLCFNNFVLHDIISF